MYYIYIYIIYICSMFMYVTYITVLYLYINMFLVFLFFLTIYTTLIAESYHQSKKKFKKAH